MRIIISLFFIFTFISCGPSGQKAPTTFIVSMGALGNSETFAGGVFVRGIEQTSGQVQEFLLTNSYEVELDFGDWLFHAVGFESENFNNPVCGSSTRKTVSNAEEIVQIGLSSGPCTTDPLFYDLIQTAREIYAVNCPVGYIYVPGNLTLGVDAFCVMQYEAKNDGNNGAVSQAAGAPWVSINQTNAKTECTNLGANYDLISNPEWMTIAHNVEAQNANWSNGTVGDGCLFRGNNGSGDACGYSLGSAESGTGRDIKARLILSNGEEIWDLAGNVSEWVDWSLGGGLALGPTSCSAELTEFPDLTCGALSAADYMPYNPSGQTASTYNSNNFGLGNFLGGTEGAAFRGGHWLSGTSAGAFRLNLQKSAAYTATNIGFRCVYRP